MVIKNVGLLIVGAFYAGFMCSLLQYLGLELFIEDMQVFGGECDVPGF